MQNAYPPVGLKKSERLEVEGARGFRIERWERWKEQVATSEDLLEEQVWLVAGEAQALLPTPEPEGQRFSFDQFRVAPDQQVILASRKVITHQNALFAFRCKNGLRYERVGKDPLNLLAGDVAFLRLQRWQGLGHLAVLESVGEHSRTEKVLVYDGVAGAFRRDRTPPHSVATTAKPLKGERYPQTRLHRLTSKEIAGWSYAQVRYALNELYARYGLAFSDRAIERHFRETTDWYQPRDDIRVADIEAVFSPLERANVALLAARRKALGK